MSGRDGGSGLPDGDPAASWPSQFPHSKEQQQAIPSQVQTMSSEAFDALLNSYTSGSGSGVGTSDIHGLPIARGGNVDLSHDPSVIGLGVGDAFDAESSQSQEDFSRHRQTGHGTTLEYLDSSRPTPVAGNGRRFSQGHTLDGNAVGDAAQGSAASQWSSLAPSSSATGSNVPMTPAAAAAALQANGLINAMPSSNNTSAYTSAFAAGPRRGMIASGMNLNDAGMAASSATAAHRASWDGTAIGPIAAGFGGMVNTAGTSPGAGRHLTPGAESSDNGGNTSSGSTKRRRMTFSGLDSAHGQGKGRPAGHTLEQAQDLSHQRSYDSFVRNSFGGHGFGSASTEDNDSWGNRADSASHLVNSKDLEAMATESLQRASAENNRSMDNAGHLSALPSNLAPQRQRQHQQQSHRGRGSEGEDGRDGPIGGQHRHSGDPASQMPRISSSVLGGQDSSAAGMTASNDFTRRKGWASRIVDELLDFSHVLGIDGTVLYATSSTQSLTGWKAEQLKGQSIYDYVHPQDAPVLKRELARSLKDKGDVLLYYRFRRNPAQIASRAKVRLHKAEAEADGQAGSKKPRQNDRSESVSSSSPTGSSSVPTSTTGETAAGQSAASAARQGSGNDKPAPVTVGEVDPDAEWLTLEMSGHPYFAPKASEEDEHEIEEAKGQDSTNTQRRGPEAASTPRTSIDIKHETPTGGRLGGSPSHKDAASSSRRETYNSPPQKTYDLPLERQEDATCFFCSCRVYPSKSVNVLDSFLELKLENEKLRRELEELNLAGDGPMSSSDGHLESALEDRQTVLTSHGDLRGPSIFGDHQQTREGPARRPGLAMIQSTKPDAPRAISPASSTMAQAGSQTFIHLDGTSRPQSHHISADGDTRMRSSFSGANHYKKSLSRLDGPVPTSNPPSHSAGPSVNGSGSGRTQTDLSSNNGGGPARSPTATASASGAGTMTSATGDEDRVCTDCGRTDSPEWRKGPLGPKTLCNACGLRYAKKIKKKAQPAVMPPSGQQPPPPINTNLQMAAPGGSPVGPAGPHRSGDLPAGSPLSGQVPWQQQPQQQAQMGRPQFNSMGSFSSSASADFGPPHGGMGRNVGMQPGDHVPSQSPSMMQSQNSFPILPQSAGQQFAPHQPPPAAAAMAAAAASNLQQQPQQQYQMPPRMSASSGGDFMSSQRQFTQQFSPQQHAFLQQAQFAQAADGSGSSGMYQPTQQGGPAPFNHAFGPGPGNSAPDQQLQHPVQDGMLQQQQQQQDGQFYANLFGS